MRAAERELDRRDPVRWAEREFYIEDTRRPIVLFPHQKAILRYCLRRTNDGIGHLPFTTITYSCIKKSGKTTIAGMVGQWAAEMWQSHGEILCVGNDADQARERAFKSLQTSVELTPGYNFSRGLLPDRWRLKSKEALCLSTRTNVKAIATDYRGEAGANPILSLWTELWGFVDKAAVRFWAEMAPSPTRPDSIRWIETYAGYEGESELLWSLYEATIKRGRQLSAGEMDAVGCFEEAPHPDDPVPCWINEEARMFTYWDRGITARRMPWQRGEQGEMYYQSEAATQTPSQYARLHEDEWVSAESSFIQIEWWDACINPLPIVPNDPTPLVVALDAAVTGDCFGIVAVSRDPDKTDPPGVALRFHRKFEPPADGRGIRFDEVEQYVRWIAANYNVVEFAYDNYQLHDMASRLMREGVGWFRPFSQVGERSVSDKLLFDLIVQRRIRHDGNPEVREHMTNANAKIPSNEDTKLRIVKKSEARKIDLVVSLSMAARECLRLRL